MTGNNTSPGEKLRALFLAALMVLSVMAAGVAFSGTAAAAGNASFGASPSTPGNSADLTASLTVGDQVSGFQAVELDFSNANNFDGDLSNVGQGDVDVLINGQSVGGGGGAAADAGSGAAGHINSVSASNNGQTLTVGLSNSQTVNNGDVVALTVGGSSFQNPSSSGLYDATLDLDPQSSGGSASGALNIGGSGGNTVLVNPATGNTIANNGNNGNSPLPVDVAGDEIIAAFDANSYTSNDNLTVVNEYTGEGVSVSTQSTVMVGGQSWYVASLDAAKDAATSSVEYYVDGQLVDREDYSTANYDLQVTPDELIHGDTVTLEGSIYEYPGNLASDETFGYSVYFNDNDATPGDSEVSSSDVNDGTFVTRKTFNDYDDTYLNDYPDDNGAGPDYEIYLGEDPNNPPAPGDANVGQDSIDSRLSLTDEGTNPSTVVYNTSADVAGVFANNSQAVRGYDLALKDPLAGTAKSTSTANDGSYNFTAVFDDAGEWSLGTSEGGPIGYQPIDVQPQDANLTFIATNDQVRNFPTDYQVVVRDSKTGNLLDLSDVDTADTEYDGYVNVSGEFENNGIAAGNANIDREVDSDNDGDIDYFHVTTDNTQDGVTFTATPLTNQVTAELENDVLGDRNPGVENEDDAADTPGSPDYAATEVIDSRATGPVNILDLKIFDDSPGGGDILQDAGPSEIEVLPWADGANPSERIQNGIRLGYDQRRNLGEFTTYFVQFEVRDAQNDPIRPADWNSDNNIQNEIKNITIEGLEANATLTYDETFNTLNVVDTNAAPIDVVTSAQYNDVDNDNRLEVQFGFRPTEAVSADPSMDFQVNVFENSAGDSIVSDSESVDATGLNISEFRVDGNVVTSVETSTTPDLTAVLNAPYDNSAPVNNGRIRLTKTVRGLPGLSQPKNETDARVNNVNRGEYNFSNVQVGPRGVNTDNDGIGEQTADLTFTGYQYIDADNNGQVDLEQDEVNRGALEELDIAPNPMSIAFDPENTSTLSGIRTNQFGEPAFTLTQGVEYEQIAFDLTYPNGSPVDLTDGMDGNNVGLNELASDPQTDLINFFGPLQDPFGGSDVDVLFDEDASNPSNGYYVIDDLDADYWIHSDDDNDNDGDQLNEDGVFSFDDGNTAFSRDIDTYRLTVEHPARTHASWVNESTGYVDVMHPKVDTNVTDVLNPPAGFSIPSSYANLDNVTAEIGRTYNVTAQLTDYFGTPINGSEYPNTYVQADIGGDLDAGAVNFYAEGNNNPVNVAPSNEDGLELDNESGRFKFTLTPTQANPNGNFDTDYYTEIHKIDANEWAAPGFASPPPSARFSDTPIGTRPVVQVYDQSGARLPIAGDTGNQILANGIRQTLRVEVFPSDPDDVALPGQFFEFDTDAEPIAENTVNTNTNLVTNTTLVTDNYRNISYKEGQLGFLTLTPTGTGDAIIDLYTNIPTEAQDENGNDIEFDVNRSNKQVNLSLSTDTVTAGTSETLVVTVRNDDTDAPIEFAEVSIADPNNNVILTNETNADGEAVFNFDGSLARGEYTVETRPAGYQPFQTSFTVVPGSSVTFDNQTVTGDNVTVASHSFGGTGEILAIWTVDANGNPDTRIGQTLSPDTGFNTVVDLDSPISSNQTLIAAIHTDATNPTANNVAALDTAQVTLTQTPAVFEVSNLSAPSSAVAGDTINVSADVANVGGAQGTQSVEFRLGGSTVQSQSVTLSGGASTPVDFNVDTTGVSPGTYTHGVFVTDDNETATIDILEPANISIAGVNSPANISQGDDLTVDVDVTNTGQAAGNASVGLEINGTNVSTGTGAADITFLIDTSGSMSGEINAVQSGLQDFTNTLDSQGVNARYAVGTFADQQPYNLRQTYTSDLSQTQSTVNAISTGGVTERSFDAINNSIDDLNERAGANEFFIVFTDEDSDTETGFDSDLGTTPSAANLSARLDSEGISLFAVTLPETQVSSPDLSVGQVANTSANGQFFNLAEGNFSQKFENEISGAIASATAGQQVSLNASETKTVSLTINGSQTQNLAPGGYSVEITVGDNNVTRNLTVDAGAPTLPGAQGPAADTDGDGLFEDIDGDGSVNVFDAIALYNNRNSAAVQDNIGLFDFDGDGSVDVFDAIELYNTEV